MQPHTVLNLSLHPSDHEHLLNAANAAGYSVDEYARLVLHRASTATLELVQQPQQGANRSPDEQATVEPSVRNLHDLLSLVHKYT